LAEEAPRPAVRPAATLTASEALSIPELGIESPVREIYQSADLPEAG